MRNGAGPGCETGAVSGYWFGFELGAPRVVTELRYRSDWWNKRPARWELWASDDPALTPDTGARLAATGDGHRAPWECVTGEPCSDGVPDECCPAGRAQPQSVAAGAHISKWELHQLAQPASGRYFFFRVVTTEEAAYLDLAGFELRGHDCLDHGGVYPVGRCTPFGVGVDAGCLATEWCSPGGERERATPTCLPIGIKKAGGTCVRNSTTMAPTSLCEAGLTCWDATANLSLCIAACDPSRANPQCPPHLPVCDPLVRGSATLPFGACEPKQCPTVFGPGCDTGFWCAPGQSYSEPGYCIVNGPLRLGDTCTLPTDCPALSICEGVCCAVCRVNGTPSCPGGMTCTVVAGDYALCR